MSGPVEWRGCIAGLIAAAACCMPATALAEQAPVAGVPRETPAVVPSAAAGATAPATDMGARIEALERSVSDLGAAAAVRAQGAGGVAVHGFADVDWAQRSNRTLPGRDGFRLGTLDFYLTPRLGERLKALIELGFEYGSDGGFATDLERMQLGYTFADSLTLWAGRFHTPYGYWNTAYHHGAQLQTTVTRPRFIEFEDRGGILPAHSIGLWTTGHVPLGDGRFAYDAYVANGDRIVAGELNFNPSGGDDSSPLFGFNVAYSPRAMPGLTVGLHGLAQTVAGTDASGTVSDRTRVRMAGGYAAFDGDDLELISEFYAFRNRDLAGNGAARSSHAGFVQGAVHLGGPWIAYARVERASLNPADPYFALQSSGSSYRQGILGLRYDIDASSALKLQLDSVRDDAHAGATQNWLRAQYAVRF